MCQAAGVGTLDIWYDHLEATRLLDLVGTEEQEGRLRRSEARKAESYLTKARTRDSVRVFTRRVNKVGKELRFVADPPLIVPIEDLASPGSEWERPDILVKKLLVSDRESLGVEHHPLEEFRYVHAAHKIVGVGSVGTRCFILLLTGRDESDPLILQVKEAQPSVLESFVGRSQYEHHGQRVVAGASYARGHRCISRLAADEGTRWTDPRLLRAPASRLEGERRSGRDASVGCSVHARICGETLARAHARWGDRIASRRTSAKAITSTKRLPTFRPPTPTRMSNHAALVGAVKSVG